MASALHPRFFERVRRRDARVVVSGVLAVLLFGIIVARVTAPETRLVAFLRKLPPIVHVAVLERGGMPGTRALVEAVLQLPSPDPLPAGQPIATLYVTRASPNASAPARDLVAVRLLEPGMAAQVGLPGVPLGGFTAVGDPDILAALRAQVSGQTVAPSVLRFIRSASGLRVLVHETWVEDRVGDLERVLGTPPAAIPSFSASTSDDAGARAREPGTEPYLAFDIEGDIRRFRFRGAVAGDFSSFAARAAPLLREQPKNAIVVLDGFPASLIFPVDLPPLFDALRRDTGVGEDITNILAAVQSQPLLLVVQSRTSGAAEVLVGVSRPAGDEGTALETAVRTVLNHRLAIVGAVTERIRVGETVIRHHRPGPATARAVTEEPRGTWRLLTAHRAAGPGADVIAALHDQVVLFSTSRETLGGVINDLVPRRPGDRISSPITGTAALRRLASPRSRTPDAAVVLDGARLRRLPVIALALRGASEPVRRWADAIEMLRLDVSAGEEELSVTASGELRFSP